MNTRWVTWVDGEAATVELSREGDTVRARIETAAGVREVAFEVVVRAANGERALRMGDGRTVTAWVGAEVRAERCVNVGGLVSGHDFAVKVRREVDALLLAGDDGAGSGAVSVAMPGRVVKVFARVGDRVEKGQPVLIIEAMKMENEVKAKRAGVVRAVNVVEGGSVEGGTLLMEIG
jgi:biotin carboxyl carrier protein